MGIIYINLDNRPDRRKSIEEQLSKYFSSNIPIERLSATYIPKNGHKGCADSHYRALNRAIELNWDVTIIFEDDFTWIGGQNEFDLFFQDFQKLKNDPSWKVILLASVGDKTNKSIYPRIDSLVGGASTASGYIVNKSYLTTLRDLYRESYLKMSSYKTSGKNWEQYAIDQQWKTLQGSGWYLANPKLGEQNQKLVSTIQSTTNYSNTLPTV